MQGREKNYLWTDICILGGDFSTDAVITILIHAWRKGGSTDYFCQNSSEYCEAVNELCSLGGNVNMSFSLELFCSTPLLSCRKCWLSFKFQNKNIMSM